MAKEGKCVPLIKALLLPFLAPQHVQLLVAVEIAPEASETAHSVEEGKSCCLGLGRLLCQDLCFPPVPAGTVPRTTSECHPNQRLSGNPLLRHGGV